VLLQDQNEAIAPLFIVSPISWTVIMSSKLLVVYPMYAPMILEVLTRCWGSTPVSLCWSTEQTLDFSSPIFDRGNRYVLSGILLIVMSWWCIVDGVRWLDRLCWLCWQWCWFWYLVTELVIMTIILIISAWLIGWLEKWDWIHSRCLLHCNYWIVSPTLVYNWLSHNMLRAWCIGRCGLPTTCVVELMVAVTVCF